MSTNELIKSGDPLVQFGTSNPSQRVNEILDHLVHDTRVLRLNAVDMVKDIQALYYAMKAKEYDIDQKMQTLITGAASLQRTSVSTISPRSQGIRIPIVGGGSYMVDDSDTTTANIVPEFGHITPAYSLQEDKLRYIDGTVPDALKITISHETESGTSALENYVKTTDPKNMVDGKGWVAVTNLAVSSLSDYYAVATVRLPVEVLSTSMFNNIRIVPIGGTYVRSIGTTPGGSEIYTNTATTSEKLDLYFAPLQSEYVYITLGTSVQLGTAAYGTRIEEAVVGIEKLELYYNEYEESSTFIIKVYDILGDGETVAQTVLRPHIPEVYLYTGASGIYSDVLDTSGSVTASVDTGGTITFTIERLSETVPYVISKIKFAMI